MAGVPGAGGPPPKRQAQRRRVNKPDVPVETAAGADEVPVPVSDAEWHPVAKLWFDSLERSGQSAFYEPSDWGVAYVIAESISRELSDQPMVVGSGEAAHVEMVKMPPKGASLSAWLKGMTALMVTEGDRRRMRLELERTQPTVGEGDANVSELDIFRQRLQGKSS